MYERSRAFKVFGRNPAKEARWFVGDIAALSGLHSDDPANASDFSPSRKVESTNRERHHKGRPPTAGFSPGFHWTSRDHVDNLIGDLFTQRDT